MRCLIINVRIVQAKTGQQMFKYEVLGSKTKSTLAPGDIGGESRKWKTYLLRSMIIMLIVLSQKKIPEEGNLTAETLNQIKPKTLYPSLVSWLCMIYTKNIISKCQISLPISGLFQ